VIVPNPRVLEEFRRTERCELCGRPINGQADPHHISKRGMGGGSALDARWNLLGLCRECHGCIEDARPIKFGPYKGACLRDADQYLIVSHREGIPLEVDLQLLAWWFDRLDKHASKWRIVKALDELGEGEQKLAMQTLAETEALQWG
jgi:hypothetical protein